MVKILREADATAVVEVARQHGNSDQTIYLWRKRFGKLEAAYVKRLLHLEQENTKLKNLDSPARRARKLEGKRLRKDRKRLCAKSVLD